jgi:teichoic acid transport system permease protein
MIRIIKENINNFSIIRNMAKYEDKSNFQSNRLGILWKYINPLFQILITFVIFSKSYSKSSTTGYSYLIWLTIGIIVWSFLSSSITSMSSSIFRQIGIVSKTNFPISNLPQVSLYSNFSVFIALNVVIIIAALLSDVKITAYWIQIFYYIFAMIYFLFALGLLTSTISVVFRDFNIIIGTLTRILFFASGVFLDVIGNQSNKIVALILENNPLYYLINGYRESILSTHWFYEKPLNAIVFWSFSTIILILGIKIHLKFRSDLSIYS